MRDGRERVLMVALRSVESMVFWVLLWWLLLCRRRQEEEPSMYRNDKKR